MAVGKKEIVAVDDESLAESFPMLYSERNDSMLDMISEAVGGETLTLGDIETVSMPGSGGKFWDVPGEESPLANMTGIMIAYGTPRVYWELEINDPNREKGARPDCSSDDSIHGRKGGVYGIGSLEHPKGDCETCPMNEWGSANRGRGKACKERRAVYLLLEGSLLPVVVNLAPASIKGFKQYVFRTASRGTPYWSLVTKVGLAQKDGPGGAYSFATFTKMGEIPQDKAERAHAFGEYLLSQALTRGTLTDIASETGDKDYDSADA
jgi:hypothetical protein